MFAKLSSKNINKETKTEWEREREREREKKRENNKEKYISTHTHKSLVKPLTGLHSKSRLPSLPVNIILGWNWRTETNTLDFTIQKQKSFIIQDPERV